MQVTDIRIRKVEKESGALVGFASVTFDDAIVIHDIGHQFDIGGMPHMTTTLYRDKYAVEMFDLLLANLAA